MCKCECDYENVSVHVYVSHRNRYINIISNKHIHFINNYISNKSFNHKGYVNISNNSKESVSIVTFYIYIKNCSWKNRQDKYNNICMCKINIKTISLLYYNFHNISTYHLSFYQNHNTYISTKCQQPLLACLPHLITTSI